MPLLALEQQLLSMRAKASSALGHRQGEDPEATREWQLVKVILDFKLTVLMLRSVLGFFLFVFHLFLPLLAAAQVHQSGLLVYLILYGSGCISSFFLHLL